MEALWVVIIPTESLHRSESSPGDPLITAAMDDRSSPGSLSTWTG